LKKKAVLTNSRSPEMICNCITPKGSL